MSRILLIGSSEGIGRALAIELDKDKNNSLILSARNMDRLEELSTLLNAQNIALQIDVTNMKTFYEKNKIGYTLCDICDTQHFLKYRKDCGYNKEFPKDAVFSMLNNYFEKNIKKN